MSNQIGILFALPIARKSPIATSLVAAIVGSCLITIAAKTQVPFWPVPMTMHVFAIFFLSAVFGMRIAALIIGAYLIEGAMGFPVFSGTPQRGIGISYMIGPTGGYLVGFVIAAILIGFFADKGAREKPVLLASTMFAGLILIYGCGVVWLAQFMGWAKAYEMGVLPFIAGDLVKILLATTAVSIFAKLLRRAI